MIGILKIVIYINILITFSGCAVGLLYTDKIEPLSKNMNLTPVGEREGQSTTRSLGVPLSPVDLSATWNSRALADAAKNAGLSEFYYADLHSVSIFLGLWQSREVILYGK